MHYSTFRHDQDYVSEITSGANLVWCSRHWLTWLAVSFPKLVFRARWKRSAPSRVRWRTYQTFNLASCHRNWCWLVRWLLLRTNDLGVFRTNLGEQQKTPGLVNGCAIGSALVCLFVLFSCDILWSCRLLFYLESRWANRATRRYLIKMDTLLCVTDFVCWTPTSSTWVASVLKVCRFSWWEIIFRATSQCK